MNYEIIVVGGGHAGCEAAAACGKMGHKTLLITSNINNIADAPCNPSIGGSAKGIVVREIDALGGIMGKVTDKSQIQMKLLNSSKGPAVRALRAQIDKKVYPEEMLKQLNKIPNLTIKEGMVEDLIVEKDKIKGIILEKGEQIFAKIVILTTGTYLKSNILLGNTRKEEGPHGERPSKYLSDNLIKYGFQLLRLKTGTPPRIVRSSIDFSKTKEEKGSLEIYNFSFDEKTIYNLENQVPCYLTYTNEKTHKIINENIAKSSMYGGIEDLKSIGARYCPSVEDKVVRFKDKERHQIFLEPESIYSDEIYVQGLSTSMPPDIQELMVHSISGLENAEIRKYAYAIEYDALLPTQLKLSLETKIIENLFTAGQINGTSGYEEAAGQGLIAGINASLKLQNRDPLILRRDEAYIGVLIDDLITKGVRDPYRLLTSRAEYRLLLRNDNADLRLRQYGYEIGLINEIQYHQFLNKKEEINQLIEELKNKNISNNEKSQTFYTLLKVPTNNFETLANNYNYFPKYNTEILEIVEIIIKYEGYIIKAHKEAEKMANLENKIIPVDIDYENVKNIASEARQKLKEVQPTSIGQALRISGVNPSDISVLSIYLKKEFADDRKRANS